MNYSEITLITRRVIDFDSPPSVSYLVEDGVPTMRIIGWGGLRVPMKLGAVPAGVTRAGLAPTEEPD